jgi:hypothetical protein
MLVERRKGPGPGAVAVAPGKWQVLPGTWLWGPNSCGTRTVGFIPWTGAWTLGQNLNLSGGEQFRGRPPSASFVRPATANTGRRPAILFYL